MRKYIIIPIVIFSLFFAWACNNQENSKTNNITEIDIACNLPLTGIFATYGEAVRDGVNFALDSIINDTIKLNFDWQDNASIAKNAVTIFQKQSIDNFDVYISGVKPQTMSIIEQVSKTNKPHFVWIFDAFVTEKYKNTFRSWANYKYEPTYYLKYVDSLKPKKIAIVYAQLPHTEEEFKKIVIPQINNRGITDILVEPYLYDKSYFKDIAVKINNYKPDLIIINGFKGNLIQIIKSFREYKLIKDNNTICTFDLLDASEELTSEMLEGLRVVLPQFETRSNVRLQNWKFAFKNKYKRDARYTDAYAFDMTMAIYNAVLNKKSDENLSEAIQNVKFDGITGLFIFDQTGDLILNLDVATFKNGELIFE